MLARGAALIVGDANIHELMVAWERRDVASLLPHVVELRVLSDGSTIALLDTAIWSAIMDAIDRQRFVAYDIKAAALGYRTWAQLLRVLTKLLDDNRAEEAGQLYLAVTEIANKTGEGQ